MNRERAKELLPIIEAFSEGKEIQIKSARSKCWETIPNPLFQGTTDYRIKPEPEVVYVNKSRGGSYYTHRTLEFAMEVSSIEDYSYRAKKFIEVLDE